MTYNSLIMVYEKKNDAAFGQFIFKYIPKNRIFSNIFAEVQNLIKTLKGT